jgi:protein-tyrosine phosphatase
MPCPLWVSHAGDARDTGAVLNAGLLAVIDLALAEPPVPVTRELVYCRFPLVDGPGNPPWLLRTAVNTVASLLRSGTPTLVACGAGMSRAPSVAAAAIAAVTGRPPEECLALVIAGVSRDISPGFWRELMACLAPD